MSKNTFKFQRSDVYHREHGVQKRKNGIQHKTVNHGSGEFARRG